MINPEEFIGNKYGRLTILSKAPSRKTTQNKNISFVNCSCECGTVSEKHFLRVINGAIKSCGCLQKDKNKDRFKNSIIKGNEEEYSIYNGIKKRCYNPNENCYHRYGGRGIKMHPDFLLPDGEGFKNFLEHVGKRPSKEHSIDRKNYDGDYEYGNLKWSTIIEQANNTSSNLYIHYKDKTQTLANWCRELNCNYNLINDRLLSGWSFEKAITQPKQGKGVDNTQTNLTREQVREIFKSTEEYKILEKKYNIQGSCISKIKNRKRFIEETKDLGDPGRSSNPNNPSRNKKSLL